jgi:hypothetical protein
VAYFTEEAHQHEFQEEYSASELYLASSWARKYGLRLFYCFSKISQWYIHEGLIIAYWILKYISHTFLASKILNYCYSHMLSLVRIYLSRWRGGAIWLPVTACWIFCWMPYVR